MIYLRAGLYAEGPTDYQFLCPLLTRLMDSVAAKLFAGAYELEESIGIDAPAGNRPASRAKRIAAASVEYRDRIDLLVIHSDGENDPEAVRRERVEPGCGAVKEACALPTVACVPVREIEAWFLKDPKPFETLLGSSASFALPNDPEREIDPKVRLQQILTAGGSRRPPASSYALFGEQVGLDALRTLPAFQRFEADLKEAICAVARSQGHRAGT